MRVLVILFLAVISSVSALAGSMVLEGKYQGKNLYVVNSVSSSGVGYCVFEVLVNGEVTSDEWNSPAFEIDLGIYGFKIGDALAVTIKYKEGCQPKVINPGVLNPKPTFDISNIAISPSGLLTWETTGETGELPFIIQQYKWSKWVNVGEVMGKGNPSKTEYSFQTAEVAGENKFRVTQKSGKGDSKSSKPVEYVSTASPVTFMYDKKSSSLVFSKATNYELYNVYGQIVKKGYGEKAELISLPKNDYYVSYDNSTEKFYRK
ncbi:MAG: hypothetical protein AB8B53_11375 [Flavobacteriales bacterium]